MEEITVKLQELYNNSQDELTKIGNDLMRFHAKLVEKHIESLFGLSELELFKCISGYNIFKRVVEIATKGTDTAPLEECFALNEDKYEFETDTEFAARESYSKFSSPVSIKTIIIRMGCRNLGKRSPIEDLIRNYEPLKKELRRAFDSYNERTSNRANKLYSDCDYLHYIYSFYYEQKMVPHTFPFWRSILVFTETLKPFLDDIRQKRLTAEQLARITQVNDTSAGWGDRMYHALLWRHCLGKVLAKLGYTNEFVAEMMDYRCYIGFDVNLAMKDIYKELLANICEVLEISIGNRDPADIATVHMIDSTSTDAFAILMKSAYGSFLTSSPTPLEFYSDCDGDSNKRFCITDKPKGRSNQTGLDHINNGKKWILGFAAGVLSNICRVMESRYEMAKATSDNTYLMRMADSIDSYSATTFENGKMVKTNILVAEDFLKLLRIMLPSYYEADVINNCYLNTDKVSIRGCKKCRSSPLCDRCDNSHAIRSIIVGTIPRD